MRSLLPVGASLALLAALASSAAAQSLFSAGGFGYPLEAIDARARALGSHGIGLTGVSLVPGFAVGMVDVGLPTIMGTMQPTWGSRSENGVESDLQGTRFPSIGLAYPVGRRGVASLTFGSYLDQRWEVSRRGTVDLEGQVIEIEDLFRSDGGVSTVRLGWAQRLTPELAVGGSVGAHIGEVDRIFVRVYDTLPDGSVIEPFRQDRAWRYSAPTVSLGALWDPLPIVRVGLNVAWSGALEGRPREEGLGETREIDLPLELSAGVSALLAPDLVLHGSLGYADWTETGADLTEGSAEPAWRFGLGAEYQGFRALNRAFPLRLGYRRADLPFSFAGGDPSEWALSGGVGITLAQVEDERPVARLDVALERGEREGGSISESFWRATFTLRASGR